MAIKNFKQYVSEASAADLVGVKTDDVEELKPRAKGEKDFADEHEVVVHDYPADVEAQFKGTIVTAVSDGETAPVQQGKSTVKESVDLTEGVVDQLYKIVKDKSASKVKFANGKSLTVDLTSASAVTQVLDKLKPANAEKAKKMIERSPEDLLKMLDMAMGGK